MKIINFFAFIFLLFLSGISLAHVKKEEGLFYKYARHTINKKEPKQLAEKTQTPAPIVKGETTTGKVLQRDMLR